MFSNLSSSSISLATVTPSFVMRGAPNDLSSTTLRPLGPSVTFTALLRMSTPRSILSRASTPNLTSLLAMMCSLKCWGIRRLRGLLLGGGKIGENAHDVALLHDQQFLAVELDLGARPFAEQHAVADLSGSCSADRQFIFAAATGLCCGCSSIFNAASIALRRFKAAGGLHRSRPVVTNLISTLPSDTAFRMREANSIWIAPPMIPWAGEISK